MLFLRQLRLSSFASSQCIERPDVFIIRHGNGVDRTAGSAADLERKGDELEYDGPN